MVGTANAIIAVRTIVRSMVAPFACSLKIFKIIITPRFADFRSLLAGR
jgi:hypothetical protein